MNCSTGNPVGALQERVRGLGVWPKYELIRIEGASHCPTFTMSLTVGGLECRASGASKKEAKAEVSRKMLLELDSADKKEASEEDTADQAVNTLGTRSQAPEKDSGTGHLAGLDLQELSDEFRQFMQWRQSKEGTNNKILETPRLGNKASRQEEKGKEGLNDNAVGILQLPGADHQKFVVGCSSGSFSSASNGFSKNENNTARQMSTKKKLTKPQTSITSHSQSELDPNFNHQSLSTGLQGEVRKFQSDTPSVEEVSKAKSDIASNSRLGHGGIDLGTRRRLNFQEENNWWAVLGELSEKAGFNVTRVEERCERVGCCETNQSVVQTLVQCSTDPVLVTCVSAEERTSSDSFKADNHAAKCILMYFKL